jgi:predicted MPP superfamily phosphohydrolase
MIKKCCNSLVVLILLQVLICLSCIGQKNYFSFIILPDTQYYTLSQPDIFHRQMDWIVENKNLFNIQYVVHMGDITDNDQDYEWEVASSCFKTLENAGIPYSIVYGNNDMKDPDKNNPRYDGVRHTELFNKYFPVSRIIKSSPGWKGGFFESGKTDNYYRLFDYDGFKFIIMCLEIAPRDIVINWANNIISQNISKKVIIVTHDYIDEKGNLNEDLKNYGMDGVDKTGKPKGNNAYALYKRLLRKNPNVLMILCGHKSGSVNKAIKIKNSADSGSKRVFFEILTDYQNERQKETGEKSGNGLLKVLKFRPDKEEIIISAVNTLTGKSHGEKIRLLMEQ